MKRRRTDHSFLVSSSSHQISSAKPPKSRSPGRRGFIERDRERVESSTTEMGARGREFSDDGVSPSLSEALVFATMCIIGLPVEVHVKDGSVYSGILHTACLGKDYGAFSDPISSFFCLLICWVFWNLFWVLILARKCVWVLIFLRN